MKKLQQCFYKIDQSDLKEFVKKWEKIVCFIIQFQTRLAVCWIPWPSIGILAECILVVNNSSFVQMNDNWSTRGGGIFVVLRNCDEQI